MEKKRAIQEASEMIEVLKADIQKYAADLAFHGWFGILPQITSQLDLDRGMNATAIAVQHSNEMR